MTVRPLFYGGLEAHHRAALLALRQTTPEAAPGNRQARLPAYWQARVQHDLPSISSTNIPRSANSSAQISQARPHSGVTIPAVSILDPQACPLAPAAKEARVALRIASECDPFPMALCPLARCCGEGAQRARNLIACPANRHRASRMWQSKAETYPPPPPENPAGRAPQPPGHGGVARGPAAGRGGPLREGPGPALGTSPMWPRTAWARCHGPNGSPPQCPPCSGFLDERALPARRSSSGCGGAPPP